MDAEDFVQSEGDALDRVLAVDAESSATGIMRLAECPAAPDQPISVKSCPPPGVPRQR